jgi:hypothetical protein
MTDNKSWFAIIKKLIKKYLEKEYNVLGEVHFNTMRDKNLEVIVPEKRVRFTAINGNSWTYIKKHIDKLFEDLPNMQQSRECGICCGTTNNFIGCAQCHNRCCLKCQISILRSNSGLLVCPYCNYTVGRKVPPACVGLLVDRMLSIYLLDH